MKKEYLKNIALLYFPRWIDKGPFFIENIKYELPGLIEGLEKYFTDNNITTFTMEWVINNTRPTTKNLIEKMRKAKNNVPYTLWEYRVRETINSISNEDLLYFCLLMYVDLKDNPLAEIPKPQQKKEKTIYDFIINVKDKENFIYELKDSFPTEKGQSIKALINTLVKCEMIVYGTREFKLLVKNLSMAFGRDIGSYQSINDYKSEDDHIYSPITKKLISLVGKYKQTD